ncbi:OmpA family protein [Candidatus Babeliales bacterium]|nr:OmpA family protein [Candidatus Babeliales bacterium]
MKKFCILALCALALVPACGKKKKKEVTTEEQGIKEAAIPLADADDPKGSFFDEQVDAFVLADADWDSDGTLITADSGDAQSLSWVEQSVEKGFKPIYFDFDRYKVRADQEDSVGLNLQEAKKVANLGGTVVVEGHACHAAGSKTYNLLISEQRAQEIAYRLESGGVSGERMRVVGRGTEMPVVLGGDRNVQSPNRRVELFSLAA